MQSEYEYVALATLAALAFFAWTAFNVGGARRRYNVAAPATSGPPEFERAFRIQMNTLEGLVLFLPALWLAALYWSATIAAALGGVWIAGRLLYAIGYAAAPERRGLGFLIQLAAALALLIGALIGAGRAVLGL